MLSKIYKILGIDSARTQIISKHIFFSFIIKGASMAIGFILVPLSILYLGTEEYGLWLTIFSFIGWFSFFDFGVGNGLRNKLSESIAKEDVVLSKHLVSTAYFSVSIIIILILLVFFLVNSFISWETIFNYSGNESITKVIVVVFTIFSINLILKMVGTIYLADQKPSFPGLFKLFAQIIIIITIYLALKYDNQSLFFYGFVVVGSHLVALIIASIISFSSRYSSIRPSLSYFNIKYVKDILGVGGKFLIIQINFILIFSADNFIINYYLGAEKVTVYNIVFKYFTIATMCFSIILSPYWSSFTSAITLREFDWIKNSFRNLFRISLLVCFLIIIMIFVSDKVYLIWVGDLVKVPLLLTVLVGISSVIMVLKQPAVILINGTGILKTQILIGTVAAVVNVPLSIVLSVNYNLGVPGVVISTILIGVIGLVAYNIQAYKMVKNESYYSSEFIN